MSDAAIPDIPGPNPDPGVPGLKIPPGSCDCHAHIYGPPAQYPLVAGRSYTPPEASIRSYRRVLGALGFDHAVIVQPSVYGVDNRCTRDAVAASGGAWRGIAVVEPGASPAALAELNDAGFRGVRINLLFKGGLALAALEDIAAAIAPLGWHLQLLVDARILPDIGSRLLQLPVDFVIDHMGHMPAALGIDDPGFRRLLQLLASERCWVKLSGAYRISSQPYPYPDVEPFARALVDLAPDRMVFGTDWPHPSVKVPVPQDARLLDLLARWAPDEDVRRRILVDNPEKLYGFSAARRSLTGAAAPEARRG